MWFKVFLFLFLTTPCWAGLPPTRILDEGVDKGVAFKFDCVGAGIVCSQSGVTGTLTVGTGAGGDSVSIDGVAVTDPNFASTGDVDFVDTANVVTGTVVSVRPAAENSIEALLDLQDLQGAVTDGQVPNTITIDLATTATTANAGDSATAFFASGTLEETLLPDSATVTGWVLGTSSATQLTSPTVIIDLLDASGAVDMDYGSADVTDHTFITDGTTDADFVVPLTSIGAGEIVADALTHTQILDADQMDTKCIWFESPVAGDDFKSIWFNGTANDFQVTEIWAESDQTVTFMLQLDDGAPADCDTVDLAPAAGTAEDTALDGDCLVAAGERLDLDIASVANTPTWVSICFTGNWAD